MNNGGYATTLYVANVESEDFPTLKDIRSNIEEYLKILGIESEKDSGLLSHNGTQMYFKVRILSNEKKILLSFFPWGEDVTKWFKKQSRKAAQDVIEFCNNIGENISINVKNINLSFDKESLNSCIDISDWDIVLPSFDPPEKMTFGEIQPRTYETILSKMPTNNTFLIFTEKYKEGGKPIDELINILKVYGKIERLSSFITAKSFSEKANYDENTACIFMDEPVLLKQWYESQKIYFDGNKIPTQFVKDSTVMKKLAEFPGTKANIILEIMTKMGKTPLYLRPPEDIITCDGFLCLSDIEKTTSKLFGAMFSYSKEGEQAEEEVQIYDDIDFSADRYSIDVPTGKLDILSQRISNLIGKDMKIDVLITKEWSQDKLNQLVEKLKEKGIQVQRIYYISTKTSRFTDEYIVDKTVNKTEHPYSIIGDKTAFLRTSTGLRIYANLSHLFIRLVWPNNAKIEEDDLKKILWLVKKRIYRIQERDVLKIPEPMHIFGNLNKMYLGKFNQTLTLPLRLLI